MANNKSSGEFYEYITINEQTSGTDLGDWTNEVVPRDLKKKLKIQAFYFSIREYESDSSQASDTSSMTVTLQFMCPGDLGWQDYVDFSGNSLAVGNRLEITDFAAGARWRAGVKDGDWTSGSITVGFDW